MNKNEIAKMPEKPLVIFKTEVDRKKNDIALMSNFFDGYINQLCLDENKSSNLQIAKNVTTSKIGLVKETINKGKTLIKSDMILVPDLDNIDAEIKEKLKKGIISVNNLTFGYDGSLNNIFENVSFNIDTDWKLGLIGRNGKGKTTFLKLLQGKYEYRGTISKNVDRNDSLKIIPIESRKSPLNYIDILTREQIEDSILKYNPTLIFVEHDKIFVEKVATKIITIEK